MGWKIQGKVPEDLLKMVMIGAPHTSNWDLFTTVCCAWYYGLEVHWLGKESLFKNFFMRHFMTFMGGIKVDRQRSENTVERIAKTINESKRRFCLVIAPEGTRSKKPGWRSGFYFIAKKAQIPIGLGYTNYRNRTMGVGKILYDLKDIDSSMETIREFYKNIVGKHPLRQSSIQIAGS